MTKVLVATTVAPYKMDHHPDETLAWLLNWKTMTAEADRVGYGLEFFATIELDGRGRPRMAGFTAALANLGGTYWTFSIDTGVPRLTGNDRLVNICTGRNLILERANLDQSVTHVLFLDSDVEVPGDSVSRLLEIDWPVVGGVVPTYCLDGPRVTWRPGVGPTRGWIEVYDPTDPENLRLFTRPPFPEDRDIRSHWNTAGFLMVRREVFRKFRWGWDLDGGRTDDPWTQDRLVALGFSTWVDHGLIGKHHPPSIVPVTERGHDLTVYR